MNAGMGQIFRERPIPIPQRSPVSPTGDHHDDDDNDNDETQEESESDGASSQMSNGPAGQREYKQPDTDAYDPKMYQDLPVPLEVKDLFKYIDKYQPRDIVLETKLKPFIPEYVPAIGDIDAFLKVPRPDGKVDNLGLIVLDEPSSKQSDPHVLSLKMRYTSKQSISSTLPTNIRTVANADKNPKAIDEWITNITPDSNMNAGMGQIFRERPIPIPQRSPVSPTGDHHDDDDNDNDETQEESESDGASSQMSNGPTGQREYKQPDTDAYDPKMYQDLPVPLEVKDLFKYIDKYQPRDIVLETKLKPFIPEYVPAIGDIDAFLKVPRPDGKVDNLGLIVLDEPSSKQSDPHVLSLKMRYTSKQSISSTLPTNIRTVANADKNPKAIDEWITNISKLQKAKTTDTVQYRKPMPNIDDLMQEWPTQFEDLLKETSVPSADIDTDLTTYTDIACALLDIPVYESRIQSLHALFSLYLGFKNSENIRTVANADKNPKAIDEWITNISKLQKAKTTDTVQYRKPMPNIDDLMQEWPTQFEDLLKETSVPSADIDTDLTTYTDIACALLDIPVYESRIQSLHALFSLYLGFKNSEHFKAMMDVSAPSFRRGGNNTEADHMIID
ncbi:unnamed protein product [Adineta steineri]|uniref:Intraflagellar transport protein 46 homolog n=1 Tax=Adineta steineri TaxID=433720 RepID=A0A814TZ60_9BILA|nr:unnamed protein product [Adineta steineri]